MQFAAYIVMGYEYHDDYITTQSFSLTVSPDAFTYARAEKECEEFIAFANTEDDWWYRIESIEMLRGQSMD